MSGGPILVPDGPSAQRMQARAQSRALLLQNILQLAAGPFERRCLDFGTADDEILDEWARDELQYAFRRVAALQRALPSVGGMVEALLAELERRQ